MLTPNHPDDELLAALASDDADAARDASVTSHVATCAHCTALIDELGALRASLADLPDLKPSRPLRFIPDVPPASGVERAGGWARRLFGPVLAAGAALAMVGMVGTAAPALSGMAASGAESQASTAEMANGAASPTDRDAYLDYGSLDEEGALGPAAGEAGGEDDPRAEAHESVGLHAASSEPDRQAGRDATAQRTDAPAERSPWPMVLFAGVALMISAALLRWILVPRAG